MGPVFTPDPCNLQHKSKTQGRSYHPSTWSPPSAFQHIWGEVRRSQCGLRCSHDLTLTHRQLHFPLSLFQVPQPTFPHIHSHISPPPFSRMFSSSIFTQIPPSLISSPSNSASSFHSSVGSDALSSPCYSQHFLYLVLSSYGSSPFPGFILIAPYLCMDLSFSPPEC